MSLRRHDCLPIVLLCLLCALASPALLRAAPPMVAVKTTGGQIYEGQLDAASDADRLRLRWTGPGMALSTGLAWGEVAQVQLDGRTLRGAELRALLPQLTAGGAAELAPPPRRGDAPRARLPNDGERSVQFLREPALVAARHVHSLHVEAVPANWDADPQIDGLAVHIAPVDATGRVVAARGDLELTAYAYAAAGLRDRKLFPQLARRSFRVQPDHFTTVGAVYHLPWRRLDPETDYRLGVDGEVRARLAVAGQGRVAAAAPVRVRSYNPLRDLDFLASQLQRPGLDGPQGSGLGFSGTRWENDRLRLRNLPR